MLAQLEESRHAVVLFRVQAPQGLLDRKSPADGPLSVQVLVLLLLLLVIVVVALLRLLSLLPS